MNDYKHTVFLPKTDFSMRANLPKKEPEIFNHLKVYLCNRNSKKSLPFLLP